MLYEFFVGLFVAMRLLWVLLLAVEQCHIPWSVPFTLFEASIIVTTKINKFLYAAMEDKMAVLKPLVGHVPKMRTLRELQI